MQDTTQLATDVRVGDVLAEKYRVERVLGVGGMGVVVAAYHLHLDEHVAIKFLLPEALLNSEVVARFAREARAAVKIKSEHVARVIDVGSLPSGAPYMVMEYLDGCDLSTWLQQRGALPLEKAVEFVLQACEAIAEAHCLGIVHRDLKPANLFCIRRQDGLESVKVLDFGISKVTNSSASASDRQLTRTSSVFGSPLYMSPEQLLSTRDVDCRTDIWALGTILYELLTRRSPFDGESLPEVYARISSQPPPPLRDFRPDAPLEVEGIILKCLERDRTRRYSNVAEFARALAPFGPRRARASVDRITRVVEAAGFSASAVALPPSSELDPQFELAVTGAAWGQTSPTATRRANLRRYFFVGMLPLVAVLGLAAVMLRESHKNDLSGAGIGSSAPISPTNPNKVAAPATSAILVSPIAAGAEPGTTILPSARGVKLRPPATTGRLAPAATAAVVKPTSDAATTTATTRKSSAVSPVSSAHRAPQTQSPKDFLRRQY